MRAGEILIYLVEDAHYISAAVAAQNNLDFRRYFSVVDWSQFEFSYLLPLKKDELAEIACKWATDSQ